MNYVQHNKELHDALYNMVEPVVFTKSDSALLKNHKPFFLPDWSQQMDYEAQLVVRISRLGKSIPERFAHRYYDAVTVGIDFTARDLLEQARQKGLPWTAAKDFDNSAVIGDWVELAKGEPTDGSNTAGPTGGNDMAEPTGRSEGAEPLTGMADLHFHLDVNGTTVQRGYSGDMLWTVDALVAYISRFFTLKTGDLLFTGTPSGWGTARIDDHLEGWLGERKILDFHCK